MVKKISLRAYGKINWVLDVISKRPDGYHDVEMIMQSVKLFDLITIEEADQGIRINSNWKSIPKDKSNIAYRAAQLIIDRTGINFGVDIYLHKNIPVAAGMGGGSADGACVLIGLNKLLGLGVSDCDIMDMALSLGADVPFCMVGGTALACGIGEQLIPIEPFSEDVLILIVKPDFSVLTAQVYNLLDIGKITKRPDISQMLEALKTRDLTAMGNNMCNVLEHVVFDMYPEVSELKRHMIDKGASGSLMSGSGPAVYGIFEHYEQAYDAYKSFKKRYPQSYLTHTYGSSLDIVEELQ